MERSLVSSGCGWPMGGLCDLLLQPWVKQLTTRQGQMFLYLKKLGTFRASSQSSSHNPWVIFEISTFPSWIPEVIPEVKERPLWGAWGIVQWLRAPLPPIEVLGSVISTLPMVHNHDDSTSEGSYFLFWAPWAIHAWAASIQAKCSCTKNKINPNSK